MTTNKIKRCTVTVDASFCPETHCAGWACWISWAGTSIKVQGIFKQKPSDSGQAEYWAIRNALHVAHSHGFNLITVNTDCEQAIKQAQDADIKNVRYCHVTAHVSRTQGARYYVHHYCDKHARQEMRKWRTRCDTCQGADHDYD